MSGATPPAGRVSDAPFSDSNAGPREQLALICALRDEWLRHGLCTLPADRAVAEEAVSRLYGLIGEPPPHFHWVDSPAAARELIAARRTDAPTWRVGGTLPTRGGAWPVAARLASLLSDLRARLDHRIARSHPFSWNRPGHIHRDAHTLPPQTALAAGLPIDAITDITVEASLAGTLRDALCAPVRTALLAGAGSALGLTWYGQQDADWVGHYDTRRRAGLAVYGREDDRQLALWAALARSTGWWWPAEGRCILAERPVALHTEALPHGHHGQRRLHREDGPAVRFADGAEVHSLHGTLVPAWVVNDPTVERIHAEPNIEVRRCAIERVGWEAYIEQAGLELVSTAPDPGNPGSELRLYHLPQQSWGVPARVLLAVNGSVEPDGRRRRYGLSVPPYLDDPLAAAGWSYGLSGRQYAQLVRRT